jgi:hypothetical protein
MTIAGSLAGSHDDAIATIPARRLRRFRRSRELSSFSTTNGFD